MYPSPRFAPPRRPAAAPRCAVAAGLAALALAAAAGPPPAAAQVVATPPPAEDFTFRSVRPPAAGAGKRLSPEALDRGRDASAAAAWFWTSPGAGPALTPRRPLAPILAAQGARLAQAARRRGDLAAARALMAAHGAVFEGAAAASGLSLPLLLAAAVTESAGRPGAVSPKGARGLMQLMPGTAAELGVDDPHAPAQAVPAAAARLSELLARFGEDPLAALAAYNAGAAAVDRHGGAPPYAETRAYVPRLLAAFAAIRRLCLPPPSEARAPCAAAPALRGGG